MVGDCGCDGEYRILDSHQRVVSAIGRFRLVAVNASGDWCMSYGDAYRASCLLRRGIGVRRVAIAGVNQLGLQPKQICAAIPA